MKKMSLFLKKAKLRLVSVLLFFVCVAVPHLSMAQGGGIGFDNSDTSHLDIVDVPIDGGTIILVLGGVLFGAYKLYKIAQSKKIAVN
jgi:hypothetical protein